MRNEPPKKRNAEQILLVSLRIFQDHCLIFEDLLLIFEEMPLILKDSSLILEDSILILKDARLIFKDAIRIFQEMESIFEDARQIFKDSQHMLKDSHCISAFKTPDPFEFSDAADLRSMRRICVRCRELAFDSANECSMPRMSVLRGK